MPTLCLSLVPSKYSLPHALGPGGWVPASLSWWSLGASLSLCPAHSSVTSPLIAFLRCCLFSDDIMIHWLISQKCPGSGVCVCVCVCVCVFIQVQLFETPCTAACPGIFQTKILELVAISYFRRSSRCRYPTFISCIGRQILYHYTTWEAPGSGRDDQIFTTDSSRRFGRLQQADLGEKSGLPLGGDRWGGFVETMETEYLRRVSGKGKD